MSISPWQPVQTMMVPLKEMFITDSATHDLALAILNDGGESAIHVQHARESKAMPQLKGLHMKC
jgi:hypothetical protein